METKKIGTYDLDILELKEFKKYYYDHKDDFTTTAFNSFLKTVDIPAKFFKEQPETTQDELLDNREVFVTEKKKYLDKVIIVLRADDKILNACRLKKEEFNILYPKLKKIDEVPNKFEHRSFYKDGYITYVISEDLKNNEENKVLVVDFPVLLNKPLNIHKATYTLPNDSSLVPVEHIHYIESEEIDLYVDYKDVKEAIEDKIDFIKTGLVEVKEAEDILREVELVTLALVNTETIPKSYVEKVTSHIKDGLKEQTLNTYKLEKLVLDFDEDLRTYKQVTNLRKVNGQSVLKVLESDSFKSFIEEMNDVAEKIE